MKKSVFWKMCLFTAFALGVNACSSSSGPEDDEETSAEASSSSSGKAGSSSSKNQVVCKTLQKVTLAAPTNLQVVKNGDNKWVLFWNYTANDERPETSFLIEVLNMSDSNPEWKTLDTTKAAVIMYNLVGESKAGKYYRVSAKDECGVSKTTDMLQVTSTGTTTTSSAELAKPTNLKLDTLGNNMWQLSWSYTNNSDRPEQGFKLQSLNIDASSPKWTDDGTTNKGVHVIKIDGTKKGGLLFHVAAKDTNGISEYSEEITIPRVSSDTSKSSSTSLTLAVPTNLKIDSVGVNKYQLSWSYTDNTARPENGFKLQSLDLTAKSPAWAAMDSTNKGVRYIIIDATKKGGNYIRVAAKDSKGLSEFSTEIMIPKADTTKTTTQEIELAVPTSLKLDSLGENNYRISWSYTNNKGRNEAGFKAQYLDMTADAPTWKDYPSEIKTGVHYLNVSAQKYGGMFFHIAAKDAKGTSTYSTEIQIPKYSLTTSASEIENVSMAVPTNLKIDSISPTTRRLSWSYTNVAKRPENGFIIQNLDLSKTPIEWNTIDSTKKGVHYWNIDAKKYSKQYLRVAAKDTAKNLSEFSSDIMVPEYIDLTANNNTTVDLAIPTSPKLDSINETTWQLSWSYSRTKGRAETGFIVQHLTLNDAAPDWAEFAKTKAGVKSIKIDAKTYEGHQFRIAAYDANDTTEYTSEVQMPIYKEHIVKLAIPTNLSIDSIAPNKWRISWNYTDNDERPATGFKLENTDATASGTWKELGSTTKDIQFYIYSVPSGSAEQYVRIAATDGNTPAGGFSDKILVPKYTNPETPKKELNVPTSLNLESIGNNEYLLSWSYTNAENRPAKGFVLQKLSIANGKSWEDVTATIEKDVTFFKLSEEYCDYFIRVAAKDENGISEYSTKIQVPSKGVEEDIANPPTDIALARIAPSVWELTWKYESNVESANRKFIIQSSKLESEDREGTQFQNYKPDDFEWTDVGAVINGNVRTYYIIGRDNIETFYRMAVVNNGDTSAFTETIQLTPEIAYREYMALNVPVPSTRWVTSFVAGIESDQDTSTRYDATLSGVQATYTITGNFISKYIRESKYTDTVYYQARWFTSLEQFNTFKSKGCEGKKESAECDSCYWIEEFPYEEPSIAKGFYTDKDSIEIGTTKKSIYDVCVAESQFDENNHPLLYDPTTKEDLWFSIMATEVGMSNCLVSYLKGICDYFVQFRIVWRDKNGETDYSEWTVPYNIAEMDIAKKFCAGE